MERFARWLGHVATAVSYVALAAIFVLMVLNFVDVGARTAFSTPIGWVYGVSGLLMLPVLFLVLGKLFSRGGHIQVTLLTSRLPLKVQKALELFWLFLTVVLFGIITWQATAKAWGSFQNSEIFSAGTTHLPIFPWVSIIAFGSFLFCLHLFVAFVDDVRILVGKQPLAALKKQSGGHHG